MNTAEEKLSLEQMAHGAATERFNDALNDVLKNIIDPNTGKGTREIKLNVKFKPNDERSMIEIKIECKALLVGAANITTHAFIGQDIKGHPEAYEVVPMSQQPIIFDSKVISIKGGNNS